MSTRIQNRLFFLVAPALSVVLLLFVTMTLWGFRTQFPVIIQQQNRDSAKLQELGSSQARAEAKLAEDSDRLTMIEDSLSSLIPLLRQHDAAVAGEISLIKKEVSDLAAHFNELSSADAPEHEPPENIRSVADVNRLVEKLGEAPSAESLAAAAAELDSWFVKPEEDEQFLKLRSDLDKRVRAHVEKEVTAVHGKALTAESAKQRAELYAEAGRLLALYPLSDNKEVLDGAKHLAADHAEVASRLEVLTRQRYNQWVTQRVAAAIDGYNAKKSYWSPKKENPELIKSLVANLGEVDPVLLEPAVLELYNYVLDLTKSSISEADKVDLARRLTDPKIKRRKLGDL